jgi:hypothetical protein
MITWLLFLFSFSLQSVQFEQRIQKEAEYTTTTTTTTKSVVVLDEKIIKEEKDTYTLHSRSKYEKDKERWAAACS